MSVSCTTTRQKTYYRYKGKLYIQLKSKLKLPDKGWGKHTNESATPGNAQDHPQEMPNCPRPPPGKNEFHTCTDRISWNHFDLWF